IQLRTLDLQEREAERRIHAALRFKHMCTSGGEGAITLVLGNKGRRLITATAIHCRIEWTAAFYCALRDVINAEFGGVAPTEIQPWISGEFPSDYKPLAETFSLTEDRIIAGPGEEVLVNVPWADSVAVGHFAEHMIPFTRFEWLWACFHFDLDLIGE